jgi:peptidoglycan hydrolase-like protein with peptidoglycan-binding domain
VKATDMRLAKGDRGSQIGKLQRLLRLHGFSLVALDEFFDESTNEAVIQFQQEYDLEASGIVNLETWKALREMLVYSVTDDSELYKGIRKPLAVMQLQWLLRRHRYLDVEVDGRFSSVTQKAVIDFQLKHNLPADGIVNSLTWAALRNNLQKTS